VVVIEPTTCGGALLTVTASVSGTPLPSTASVTAAAPAVYGACNAALWLDASDATTITQSGGVLTGWQDKSGAQRHSSATAGPTVVAGGFNGRTALRFNGVTQFIPITDVASGTPYTLVVVDRRRSGRSTNFVIGGTTALVSNNLQLGYQSGTSLRFATHTDNLDAAVPAFTSVAAEPGRVTVGRWTTGFRSLYSNTALLAGDAGSLGVVSWTGAAIGRLNTGTATVYYDGDVGEVILFRRSLSDAEFTALSNALMVKWSLGTLTATAGQSQVGTFGAVATTPPKVRVTNAANAPLAGATITWQVIAGGGTLASATTTTDANGEATASWTLGNGTNTLRATYGTQSADFTATTGSVCVSVAICDPALWVDATDASTITTTSGTVTEWRDKSGAGRHFTAAAASGPTRVGGLQPSKQVLRFNGTTNFMTLADRPWSGTGAYTLVVVERRRADGAGGVFGRANAGTNGVPIVGYSSGSTAYVSHGTGSLSVSVSPFGTSTEQATRVWSVQYANGTRTLRINNRNIASDNTVGGVTTFSGATVGRHAAEWYSGDIGEVVLIPRAVSDADLQTYTLSLMAKWGAGILEIDAGDTQEANAGTSPAIGLRVRLSDGNGNGLQGVTLRWQVTEGGGRLNNGLVQQGQTDATGYMSIPSGSWRLDNGSNRLTVWQSWLENQGPNVVFRGTGQLPGTRTIHLDAQDASSFTLNGATGVATWRDRAGSARTVAQSTPGQQPNRNASVINARPAVVFSGNSALLGNTVSYGITFARSVFIVFSHTGTVSSGTCAGTDGTYLLDRDPAANATPLTSIKAVGGRWVLQTRADALLGASCAPSSGGVSIVNGAPTIFSAVQSFLSTSVWGNGTFVATSNNVAFSTMQPIILGRSGSVSSAQSFTGAIGEVLVFNGALSTTDRQIVERYLGWKWGVTVP
jgi:hypothetical protein